jgi:hypothetical protein
VFSLALLLVGCLSYHKQQIEYITIGVVDRHDNGVCVIEIHQEHFGEYVTIFMNSSNCKDGDIIAVGRKK